MKKGRHKEIDPKGRKIIIFMGGEGSGKSTLGKLLSKHLNTPYVSTGDIIRESAKNDKGLLGDASRKMIKENAYLDPNLIARIIAERLSRPDIAEGVVIDGALRTLEETQNFDKTLELAGKGGFEVNVVFLDVDEETGINRRLNSDNKRSGETRATILIRLSHFKKDLEERIKIARKRYRFFEIDANPSAEKVFASILSALNI